MKFETQNRRAESMEKSRTISDAELLAGGAEYEIDAATGEKRLMATEAQIAAIHQTVERLLAEGIVTPESLRDADLKIEFDDQEGDIGYEFELEEEQRIMVEPDNFDIKEWKNHVVDVYDASGRCRVRIKNGEPRMSLKVPLFSRDTEKAKCCIRLEFKPRQESQTNDLLTIVELIAQEPGTQIHEKWGTPLKLNNGEKVWINRNENGEYWIETDTSEKIEELLPDGIRYLGHKKSSIRMPQEGAGDRRAVIDKLMSLNSVKTKLNDPKTFEEIFNANQRRLSRSAKGKMDTSVSSEKAGSELAGAKLAERVKANSEKLLGFLSEMKEKEFASAAEIKELLESIVRIINDGIFAEPLALRTWEVNYGREKQASGLADAMKEFYENLLAKLDAIRKGKSDPTALAAWIELEINRDIHPFADGCGRSSQALAAFFLKYFNSPLPLFESREAYYAAMNNGDEAFRDYYYRATEKSLVNNYLH